VKILFLATWFPYPSDSGSKLRVYHLLRALGQVHEVTLLSFAFDTARPDEPGGLRLWCRDIRVVPIDPFAVNQEGVLRTFLSAKPVVTRPLPAMKQLVTDVWRSGMFDAIIASTEVMADYALQETRASRGTATILEEHNSLTRWEYERYAEQTSPLQRLRCWASWQKTRRFEAGLFSRFDLVTMVSEQDRATSMTKLPGYRGSAAVVPNGVDCWHNQPGLAQPRPDNLIFNGSLTYFANFEAMRWFLAHVYPQVKAQIPRVTLTITGSTRGVDLAGLALDNTVRLTGFVDDVRVPVAEAGVCVVPIRQGGGTRLKIMEAMALGTPVVATTKGAEGLQVVSEVDLLLADTPENFARATVRLLREPALRAALATNARRLVEEKYDWHQIGARFLGLVEQTAAAKPQEHTPK
jgi:polysaccharide biosynthesis protein PslH